MAKIEREFTRLILDARKTAGLTQDEAANILGCSINTLQKYEADDIRVHDDMAASMTMVYRDPRLKKWYCENECQVGCQEPRCGLDRSEADTMLDIMLVDPKKISAAIRTLKAIMSDGVVDAAEEADFDECIGLLDSFAGNIDALKLQLQLGRDRAR